MSGRPALGLYSAARQRLLHPRTMLVAVAVLYALTAWQTTRYTPEWLEYPDVWAGLAFTGAAATLLAVLRPRRLVVAGAGAATVVAAFARAFAIVRELAFDPPPTPEASAAFVIAAATWFAVALLLWETFVVVVIPWSAATRRGGR